MSNLDRWLYAEVVSTILINPHVNRFLHIRIANNKIIICLDLVIFWETWRLVHESIHKPEQSTFQLFACLVFFIFVQLSQLKTISSLKVADLYVLHSKDYGSYSHDFNNCCSSCSQPLHPWNSDSNCITNKAYIANWP